MFKASTKIAQPIKVIVNGRGKQWGRIKDVVTGKTLHTGRWSYIKSVAKKRYNHKVS